MSQSDANIAATELKRYTEEEFAVLVNKPVFRMLLNVRNDSFVRATKKTKKDLEQTRTERREVLDKICEEQLAFLMWIKKNKYSRLQDDTLSDALEYKTITQLKLKKTINTLSKMEKAFAFDPFYKNFRDSTDYKLRASGMEKLFSKVMGVERLVARYERLSSEKTELLKELAEISLAEGVPTSVINTQEMSNAAAKFIDAYPSAQFINKYVVWMVTHGKSYKGEKKTLSHLQEKIIKLDAKINFLNEVDMNNDQLIASDLARWQTQRSNFFKTVNPSPKDVVEKNVKKQTVGDSMDTVSVLVEKEPVTKADDENLSRNTTETEDNTLKSSGVFRI